MGFFYSAYAALFYLGLQRFRVNTLCEPFSRQQALVALSADLSDLLDWATAEVKEGRVLLHA